MTVELIITNLVTNKQSIVNALTIANCKIIIQNLHPVAEYKIRISGKNGFAMFSKIDNAARYTIFKDTYLV